MKPTDYFEDRAGPVVPWRWVVPVAVFVAVAGTCPPDLTELRAGVLAVVARPECILPGIVAGWFVRRPDSIALASVAGLVGALVADRLTRGAADALWWIGPGARVAYLAAGCWVCAWIGAGLGWVAGGSTSARE